MVAEVRVYGGEPSESGWYRTVTHWQLWVDGVFVADGSTPEMRDLFFRIVGVINGR